MLGVRRIEVEENWMQWGELRLKRCGVKWIEWKIRKPSSVAIEMCKASDDKCFKSLANIFNDILFTNKLPEKWMLSLLTNF